MSLLYEATGKPAPMIKWRKAFSHVSKERTAVVDGNLTIFNITKTDGGTYECSANNLLGKNSAVAQVLVTDRLKFTLTPPLKVNAFEKSIFKLNCAALGNIEITWKKSGQHFPVPSYPNGTLLVKNVAPRDAGSYKCVARNLQRSIEATTVVEVPKPVSCSSIKTGYSGSPSGNYVIDPDGEGGVNPFSVYCDMRHKGGVGVTVISHDSESRTHVNHISPGCGGRGCYRKDVTYTGVSTTQLAALTRVSQNCEQFIKYECNPSSPFIESNFAWWVSRDGRRMDYWGGATGHHKMCACGVTNTCTTGSSRERNCPSRRGWSEDSGLLTDKSALPVSQIRLGDLNSSGEEGYHTLGKLKCYG